jgi:hypothetical protein
LHDWTRSSNPAQGTVGQIMQCKSRGDGQFDSLPELTEETTASDEPRGSCLHAGAHKRWAS